MCRFGYPKFPIWFTILVKPYETEFPEEKKAYMKKYAEILKKVRAVMEDEEVIAEIMKKYNKDKESKSEYETNRRLRILELLEIAGVEPNEYIEALSWCRAGFSLHQKRDLDEMYINSYNPEWILAWNGNIDIQVCLDFFAVITYITEYFSKDETKTMEIMKRVLDNNPDDETKEKMKKVASTFLSHRQIGEAEAFYKLLPDLLLKKSNVACQWLPLGPPEERFKRMKKAEENESKNLIKLENMEGLWYEQPDILSKYKRRPDELEEMPYTHYAKIFKSGGKRRPKDDDDEDEEEIADEEEETDSSPVNKFHFLMTENDGNGPELPEIIQLKSTMPKEPPFMHRRKFPAALRFHKVNKDNNPYKFFLSELMMYIPFRDENEFKYKDDKEIEIIYNNNFERIKKVKGKIMEFLEDVQEARYYVEEANKKLDLEQIGKDLDAAKEQENAECQDETSELHPDYAHIDTEGIDDIEQQQDNTKQIQNIYRKIDMPDENELKENTALLDPFQRRVIDIGIQYAKDIKKAERDGNQYPDPPHLMVHGGAGSGKTFVIKTLAQWMTKILITSGDSTCFPYVLKTAFTGTAASLIEGMTLHSAFSFSFENKHYSLSDKSRDAKRNTLQNLKMIIIDEISMVKADMLYQLDLKLQEIREKVGIPFGGVAIFCFGDLLQLQPVAGKFIFDIPQGSAYYLTHSLMPRWKMLKVLNLELNHRQGNDKQYADILNRIREGKQTHDDFKGLEKRVRSLGHPDLKEVSLYIVCTKKACSKINTEYLDSLPGDSIKIPAIHHHRTQKNYKPRICNKEGTVGPTSFMDSLHMNIG